MPLVDIWKARELHDKRIQQILGLAGDGTLRDGNATSTEFREFLAHVPSEYLIIYATQCLEQSFDGSGFALQDIVNQLGKRLGFAVESGRYRGIRSAPGHDGLWRTKQGEAILVEVKTTDTYRLTLDTTANYRKMLVREAVVEEEKSSILYVVGRFDTGDLEAQVRGSRHAWDIRIISVDALLRLVRVKEELATSETIDRIRDILMPQEFTRVDGIIDLVFTATKEAKEDEAEESPGEASEEMDVPVETAREKRFTPVKFRDACIPRLEEKFGETLVRQSFALFATPDEQRAVLCATSREYRPNLETITYWFGIHAAQIRILKEYEKSWICFGCGSEQQLFLIPLDDFVQWLPILNKTESGDRDYWHVHILNRGNKWELRAKGDQKNVQLTEYLLPRNSGIT